MKAILTSALGGYTRTNGTRVPLTLLTANGLTETLRQHWPEHARVLIVVASPGAFEKNDDLRFCLKEAFPLSGLSVSSVETCDDRNPDIIERVLETDVIVLTGGHVPTQNLFLKKLRMRERLAGFKGLIVAWSAGSMNCAEDVYAGPELEGEAVDPLYKRWLDGLGITRINIFPHYQALRDSILDGLRLMEDITLPDSMGHTFIALNDGSYVVIDGESETLYGEAYLIKDGEIRQLCEDNASVSLNF